MPAAQSVYQLQGQQPAVGSALGSPLCPTSAPYTRVTRASYRAYRDRQAMSMARYTRSNKMCLMRFNIQQQDLEFRLRREVNSPSSVSSVGSAMFPNGHQGELTPNVSKHEHPPWRCSPSKHTHTCFNNSESSCHRRTTHPFSCDADDWLYLN